MIKYLALTGVFTLIQCSEGASFQDGAANGINQESQVLPVKEDSDMVQVEKSKTLDRIEISPNEFSMRAGSEPLKFSVLLSENLEGQDVSFELMGSGESLGTITDEGLYTPPEETPSPLNLKVVAKLKTDDSLHAQSLGLVNPEDSVFLRCMKEDSHNPLVADLYILAPNTLRIPQLSKMKPKGQVCMPHLQVSGRDFEQGFPGLTEETEWFALDIKTLLHVPVSGTYTISINSDDGSKVYLNGNLLIDNDGTHSELEKGARVYMTQGYHALQVEYFQGPRTHIALELFWKRPGSNYKEYIPGENFRHPYQVKTLIERQSRAYSGQPLGY